MSSGKRKIPRRWFGYGVKETEAYLRKIESMQREEVEEIERKMKAQRARLEELQAKLSEMSSKPESPALSPEKASLLLERLDRSVEAIVSQGEAETESLHRLRERKLEQHAKRMTEWDKQSEDYRNALDFLLEEASDLIFKVKSKKSEVPDQSQLDKEAEEAMRSSNVKSAAEDVWESKERDEESSSLNEKPEPLQSSAKILQFKLRSILNEVAVTEEETAATHSSMTADGMTMDERAKALPAKPTSNKKMDSGKSFWGDMEAYLEEDEPRQSLHLSSETADVPETPPVVAEESLGLLSSEPNEPESNEYKPSPGLNDEILSIKNRYIVGKVAGEHLYASGGGLIVAKGNTITSEIVQKAEREGKLPDLIVHMVIPGLGSEGS